MDPIQYFDRASNALCKEKVLSGRILEFLYTSRWGAPLRELLSKLPFISSLVGFWQRLPWTKRNILPFIREFEVDASEFVKKPEEFVSFDDFFVRKLRSEVRPIAESDAVIPADGRYRFYQNLADAPEIAVKGERFSLKKLLHDEALAKQYEGGSLVMGRLCPSDYHRFHFPVNCAASKPRLINGWLYSVNPIALKWNRSIFMQNKRFVTELETEKFGKVLFIEVGATTVGSIHHTHIEGEQKKGAEKGFFSFGGSAVLILFKPGMIQFDQDLIKDLEVRCLIGQSMGQSVSTSNLR